MFQPNSWHHIWRSRTERLLALHGNTKGRWEQWNVPGNDDDCSFIACKYCIECKFCLSHECLEPRSGDLVQWIKNVETLCKHSPSSHSRSSGVGDDGRWGGWGWGEEVVGRGETLSEELARQLRPQTDKRAQISKKRKKEKCTVNKNTLTNMTNRLLSGGMTAFFLQNVLKLHCCVSNIKRYCFKAKDITAKMILVVTFQKANNHTGTARWHENTGVWIHLGFAQG